MCNHRFYICRHCKNIVGMIQSAGVPLVCCGEPMEELIPNSVDAAQEKHVPHVQVEGSLVTVEIGAVAHPMTEEHLIQWVYLQTEKGGQRKCLVAGEAPKVTFSLTEDRPVAVFAYCNLHGLWIKEL